MPLSDMFGDIVALSPWIHGLIVINDVSASMLEERGIDSFLDHPFRGSLGSIQ